MIIKEFVEVENSLLEKFKMFWENQNKKDSINFPNEMPHAEWIDQFTSFIERVK